MISYGWIYGTCMIWYSCMINLWKESTDTSISWIKGRFAERSLCWLQPSVGLLEERSIIASPWDWKWR